MAIPKLNFMELMGNSVKFLGVNGNSKVKFYGFNGNISMISWS